MSSRPTNQISTFTDSLRSRVRDAVGYKSWVYRAAAFSLNAFHSVRREGRQGVQLMRLRSATGSDVTLQLRNLVHPITLRPGSDDIDAVINNVVREEYGRMATARQPDIIVDAGAYIGDTAAYFLSKYPGATVVAIEPNQESFARAKKNLAPYLERAIVYNCALWDRITTLNFAGSQTGAAVSELGRKVQTITIPQVMAELGIDHIDLLKLDIEGAEEHVIPSGRGSWLNRVRTILLETHGTPIERAVLPLLEEEGFSCVRHRNVWNCSNTAMA